MGSRRHKKITRREFLQESAWLAAGACATVAGGEAALSYLMTEPRMAQASTLPPVTYPKLPGIKIQPPEKGCYFGIRQVIWWMPGNSAAEKMNYALDQLEKKLGVLPHHFVIYEIPLTWGFPVQTCSAMAKRKVKPFVYINMFSKSLEQAKNVTSEFDMQNLPKTLLKLEDIAGGVYDQEITKYAQGAKQYGEQHGGFFITTMEEMNGRSWPWAQHPKYIQGFRKIWDIFDKQGANIYATWVWEPICFQPNVGKDDPERYYPGDRYVDWIGLSGFGIDQYPHYQGPFENIVGITFDAMKKNHPNKPIFQSESGKTRSLLQAEWIKNAFDYMKKTPEFKGTSVFDNITYMSTVYHDHTLNDESWNTLKHILTDPYFITAK